jgi:HEAT repeat
MNKTNPKLTSSFRWFESILQLPIFLRLCKDKIWSVRKACCEVFPMISLAVGSIECRRKYLVPTMKELLNDSSEWVKASAYEVGAPQKSQLTPAYNPLFLPTFRHCRV